MILYFHANKTFFFTGKVLHLASCTEWEFLYLGSGLLLFTPPPVRFCPKWDPVPNNRKITAMRNLSFPPILRCTKWRHAWAKMVDCEQPLFFFRFSNGSARARERWAAKPQDARNEGGSLVSRLQSRAWSFACFGRLRDGQRKKRDCS